MKRLENLGQLEMKVTIERGRSLVSRRNGNWENVIVLTAKVVGSDGLIRDETHTTEFGRVKITKRSVQAMWQEGQLVRPGQAFPADRDWDTASALRTVTIPRVFNGASARKSLTDIRRRLSLLVAPQHHWLFGQVEARDFCADLHGYIVIADVMNS